MLPVGREWLASQLQRPCTSNVTEPLATATNSPDVLPSALENSVLLLSVFICKAPLPDRANNSASNLPSTESSLALLLMSGMASVSISSPASPSKSKLMPVCSQIRARSQRTDTTGCTYCDGKPRDDEPWPPPNDFATIGVAALAVDVLPSTPCSMAM